MPGVLFEDPKVVLQNELPYELSGAEEFVVTNVGQEIVTADAKSLRSSDGFGHALNGLPFGAFDIHFEKINVRKAELPNDGIDRSGGDANSSTSPHSVPQILVCILDYCLGAAGFGYCTMNRNGVRKLVVFD